MRFEQQEPISNQGLSHSAAQPQQTGVRLKPNDGKAGTPVPRRPPKRRPF
jgi:hypothetical protein